jgi:hypothetical protein
MAAVGAAPSANAARQSAGAAQQQLPPLSYVCPMPGDEDVLDDKPGECPKCKMTLVPVRLDSKFSCPVHATQVVRDTAGKCPLDGRDLVQVTLSVFWTCPGDDKHLTEPGACANGQPRKVGYEVRAHGDHNPRHGGQFFMAQDAWHHIEGTLPRNNLFRMFFYDNFTKPISVKNFQARIVTKEEWDPIARKTKELEAYTLRPGADGQTMEAQVNDAPLPLKVAALVKFDPKSPEQRFDFTFTELSKEPPPAPAATTTAARPAPAAPTPAPAPARPAPTTAAASAPPAQTTTPAPVATPPVAPAAAAPPASPQPTASAAPEVEQLPATADPAGGTMNGAPLALVAALDETSLPTSTPELLAELTKRADEVQLMVNEGNLAQVWLPAMGTKTVALALTSHVNALPERQRAIAAAAIKHVVTSTWELDAYGDLGNKEKMSGAYDKLAAAIAELKAAYGPR